MVVRTFISIILLEEVSLQGFDSMQLALIIGRGEDVSMISSSIMKEQNIVIITTEVVFSTLDYPVNAVIDLLKTYYHHLELD